MAKKLHVNGLFDIPVDETLTEFGKAADAAAVGEAIDTLSEEMPDKIVDILSKLGIVLFALDANDAVITDAKGNIILI